MRLRCQACGLIAILGPGVAAPQALLWHNSAPAGHNDSRQAVHTTCFSGKERPGEHAYDSVSSMSLESILSFRLTAESSLENLCQTALHNLYLQLEKVGDLAWQNIQRSRATVPKLPRIQGSDALR